MVLDSLCLKEFNANCTSEKGIHDVEVVESKHRYVANAASEVVVWSDCRIGRRDAGQ